MKQHSTSYNRASIDEENPYWISFSDIMSGLLILFILVSMTLILELIAKREEVNQKIEQIEQIEQALEQILREIKAELQAKNIVVEISENDSVIRIPDRLLKFDSGSFVIPAGSEQIVHDIGDTIRRVIVKQDRYKIFDTIFVEGHTDNQPFRNNYVKGNWGLSANRAIEVWNYWELHIAEIPELSALLNHAGEPLFSVSGFGETRPIQTPQDTAAQREKNRRIDIRFIVKRPTQTDYETVKAILEQ